MSVDQIIILSVNIIVGTIVTVLIKRDLGRSDTAIKDLTSMKEDVIRISAKFDSFGDEIERLNEAVEALQPLSITVDNNEKKIRVLTRQLNDLAKNVAIAKRRINLLRSHAIPRICDEVWASDEEST